MIEASALARLIAAADTAWRTADGVVRHREHWPINRLAGDEWEARLDGGLDPHDPPEPVDLAPSVSVTEIRVAQDRLRGLKRFQLLSWSGEPSSFGDVVVRGSTWWWRIGQEVVGTNDGDPSHSAPATGYDALLHPAQVLGSYDVVPVEELTVIGRRALRAVAVERAGADLFDVGSVFGLGPGGRDFVLDLDLETGVVLRVVKELDGQVAESLEWLELSLDLPLADELFRAPGTDDP